MLRSILSISVAVLLAAFARAEDIPVADFFKSGTLAQFRISPDGKSLSALNLWEGAMNIYVIDRESGNQLRATALKELSVDAHFWANDERIVFTGQKDKEDSYGLFAVNKDGSNFRVLSKPVRSRGGMVFRTLLPLSIYPNSADEILVLSNLRRDDAFDVLRLNVNTGKTTMVALNPGEVREWFVDWDGEPRFAIAKNLKGETYNLLRDKVGNWNEIARFQHTEQRWRPALLEQDGHQLFASQTPFSRDGKTLYVANNIGRDTYAVQSYDLANGTFGTILHEDPTYDIGAIIQSKRLQKPSGVQYHADKFKSIWLEEERSQLQTFIDAKLPSLQNLFISSTDDESAFVVASYSDRVKPFYTLLSIKDGMIHFELLSQPSGIPLEDLSQMIPVNFAARDGLPLHGYLTLPVGIEPKNLPLILNPHGGPWVRDTWGYASDVQFLASRGFAVLQVDFRGSQGYGLKHLRLGDKQWGGTMQADLDDARQWAIDQGYADPERVGIYGISYGGYATMAQLVYFPENYKFGICVVGPVDLEELIGFRSKLGSETVEATYGLTIGSPKTESDLLRAHSPIHFIDRIQAKVMIVHGTKDYRVPIGQAKVLRAALEKHGKPYEWIIKKDEGHGFRKTANKIELYEQMDKFLAPFR